MSTTAAVPETRATRTGRRSAQLRGATACATAALALALSPVLRSAFGGDEGRWFGLATTMHWGELAGKVLSTQLSLGRFLPVEAGLVATVFSVFTTTASYKAFTFAASVAALVYAAFVGSRWTRQRWTLPISVLALIPCVQLRTYHDGIGQYFAVMPLLLALVSGAVHVALVAEERGLSGRAVVAIALLTTAAALCSNLTIFVIPVFVVVACGIELERAQRMRLGAALVVPPLLSGVLTLVLRQFATTAYPIESSPPGVIASTFREAFSVVPFSYVSSEGWAPSPTLDPPPVLLVVVFAALAAVGLAGAFAARPDATVITPRRAALLVVAGLGLVFGPAAGVSLSGQHQSGVLGVGYIEVTLGYAGVAWIVAGLLALLGARARRQARRRRHRTTLAVFVAVALGFVFYATLRNNATAIDGFWAHEGAQALGESRLTELLYDAHTEPETTGEFMLLSLLPGEYHPRTWHEGRASNAGGVSVRDVALGDANVVFGISEPRAVFVLFVPRGGSRPAAGAPSCAMTVWAKDWSRVAGIEIVDADGSSLPFNELARDGDVVLAIAPDGITSCAQLQITPKPE